MSLSQKIQSQQTLNSNKKISPAEVDPCSPLSGKHILAEFWQCQCAPELLTQAQPLLDKLISAVAQTGLTLVGHAAHEFQPLSYSEPSTQAKQSQAMQAQSIQTSQYPQSQTSGVTLTLLLAESHLCLHTWGEHKTVTLDVYVCNVTEDNSEKAEALFAACQDIFIPAQHHSHQVIRQHQLSADVP